MTWKGCQPFQTACRQLPGLHAEKDDFPVVGKFGYATWRQFLLNVRLLVALGITKLVAASVRWHSKNIKINI